MTERVLIILLSLIYLGTFIARNLLVKFKTKQVIRASDPLLTASMISMSACLLVTILSTTTENFYFFMAPLSFLRLTTISYLGLFLFAISIVMGWIFSAQLKESWRVGVHDDQKTVLIKSGAYKYIRNPYFLSYFIMLIGQLLVRPSAVLVILVAITIIPFHCMVLKEEAYLSANHGKDYDVYKSTTGRYLPRIGIGCHH